MSALATAPPTPTPGIPRGKTYQEVELDRIDVDENVRTDVTGIDELAASIAEQGVLSPVSVVLLGDGRYRLIYGQRRVLAARQAGLGVIPAIVDEGSHGNAADIATEQLVENLQREDLSALEEAAALKGILSRDPGLTQTKLATRIGRSPGYVSNRLRLLELPKPVKALLADGTLSAAHGVIIAGVEKADQVEVAKQAVEKGYSSHQLEDQVDWIVGERKRRADQSAKEKADRAALRTRAVDKVKGLDRGTPIAVAGWDDGTVGEVVDAVRGAGFTKVERSKGYVEPAPGKAFCKCKAIALDLGYYGSGPSLKRRCVVKAHRTAAEKASRQKGDEKRQRAADARAVITEVVTADLAATSLPRRTAEVLLAAQLGYYASSWAQGRKGAGTKKTADAWGAIRALTDRELERELAAKFAADLRVGEIDPSRIAADLTEEEQES